MNLNQITRLFLATFVLLNAELTAQQPNKTTPPSQIADAAMEAAKVNRYAIAIHGGAGSNPKIFSEVQNDRRRASMQKALQIGTDILRRGGSSLDAVEQVVRFLENDPQFNAGVGAVFNAAGSHELDASIMDGKNQACGAVAGVSTVENPISLARKVMTDTPHVLLAGAGAEAFAQKMKVPLVKPSHFDTSATRKQWKNDKRKSKTSNRSASSKRESNLDR